MTQTMEPVVSTGRTPQQRVDAWLQEFVRGTHSMVQSLCGLRLVGRGPL